MAQEIEVAVRTFNRLLLVVLSGRLMLCCAK